MELLVGVAVVTIIISSVVTAVVLGLRIHLQSVASRGAAALEQETMESVRSVAEGKWSNLYGVSSKGAAATYKITTSPVLTIVGGSEDVIVNSITYTRFFSVENVCRLNEGISGVTDNEGSATTCDTSGGTEDPSTQKITVTIQWQISGGTTEIKVVEYLTRFRNEVTRFTDWSGQSGVIGPITSPDSNYFSVNNLNTATVGEIKLNN